MKNYCKGGSEYSGIFIFKISIGRGIFLRNTKNGHFEPKSDEKRTTTEIVKSSRTRDKKLRSLLSWQQRTIRHLSTDIGGEGGFRGEEIYHGTLPGHEL